MYLAWKRLIKAKSLFIILFAGILLSISLAVYSFNCSQREIEFKIYKNGIYVVSIDSDYFAENSSIFVAENPKTVEAENLATVEDAARYNNAKVAINAGFFDPNNGKAISYVLKDNKVISDPAGNERLMQSKEIKPYLDKIFNRAEFRVLRCQIDKVLQKGEIKSNITRFEISKHNDFLPPPDACSLVYSVQAGPELFPNFDIEEEFFILKKDGKVVRESASALHKVARSAIGIKKDKILLVAASNDNPMTLEELAGFMREIGAEQALAFDGGSSTSLYVDIPQQKFILNSASDNTGRYVKSILIVK